MPLSKNQRESIISLLYSKIDNKLKRYARETSSMPFLTLLMQDAEKVASYSFIHSLATSLGMSIYEDVSKIIASESAKECFTKYDIGGVLSSRQKTVIENIIRELRNKERKPNITEETKEILKVSSDDGKVQKEGRIADLYMLRNGIEYYFEIKTVKPNIDIFTKSKAKLLEWVARKRKNIKVFLGFPYNPYYPQPYSRFTTQNLMDPPNDFLVGEEYWDFLGGEHTFKSMLKIFDQVGKDCKSKIHEKIKQVAKDKIDIKGLV